MLTFTYIGYESLNVTVGKNHVVNAKLKPEVVIDQIVVTGFKNAKKESFTGSSVKISADDVAIAGVTDVSRMLEGQVAGVSVQTRRHCWVRRWRASTPRTSRPSTS